MQSNDFKWFVENMDELFKVYGEKYLAIKNKQVLGAYLSYAEAVNTTQKTEELGTFIVQLCGADESAYTNYIASFNFIPSSEVM